MIRLSDRHYPYTRRELQADNPRASIPRNLTAAQAAALGAALVTKVARPNPAPGMRVVESAPQENEHGGWIQQWTQVPADPPAVPESVSPHLLRRVLARMGLLPNVQTLVDALPADDELRIDWEYAPSLSRNANGIERMRIAMGLEQSEVDAIWIAADAERGLV